MSAPSYGQLEAFLRRRSFTRTATGLHNLWVNIDPGGTAFRVVVCSKRLRPIPTQVLRRLASQIGMSEAGLREELLS